LKAVLYWKMCVHKSVTLNSVIQSSSGLSKGNYLIPDKTQLCLSEDLQKHMKSLSKHRLGQKSRTGPPLTTRTLGPALCSVYSCSRAPIFI